MNLKQKPTGNGLPAYEEIVKMSDEDLLKTIKPSIFIKDINFGQKYEQDQEANRFVKFLQKRNDWTFSEQEKEKLSLYWLSHKFKSPFNDESMGVMEEGNVDETELTDTWFKKNEDGIYTCTGAFVLALLTTYSGPYYKKHEKQKYLNRGYPEDIIKVFIDGDINRENEDKKEKEEIYVRKTDIVEIDQSGITISKCLEILGERYTDSYKEGDDKIVFFHNGYAFGRNASKLASSTDALLGRTKNIEIIEKTNMRGTFKVKLLKPQDGIKHIEIQIIKDRI